MLRIITTELVQGIRVIAETLRTAEFVEFRNMPDFMLHFDSESEHDSVFGRLCMASAHFLNSNFEHCILYLNSVRTHYYNDDTFNFNFAQVRQILIKVIYQQQVDSKNLFIKATAMTNKFAEAEALFTMIQSEKIRSDFTYIQWLARCCKLDTDPFQLRRDCQKFLHA